MHIRKTSPARHRSRTLGHSVRRAAIWQVVNTLVFRLASIALTAVVARILSPHDFGVFAVALTIYTVVSSFAELGIMSCVMRRDLDLDAFAPTAATLSWMSSALLAGAMVAFARPLATALGSADAAGPTRTMAIAVVLIGLFAVPSAHLAREFTQDKAFFAAVAGFIVSTPILIILALHGSGASAFAWSRVVGHLVTGCVILGYVPKHYRPGFSRLALPELLKFGIPFAAANLLGFILLNVDYVFIGHSLGPAELGIYMIAFNVASLPVGLLSNMIVAVSLPAFSELRSAPARLRESTVKATRSLAVIGLPIAGLIAVLARPLVLTVYGAKWAQAAPVMSVLSVYGAISLFCVLFANVLSGLGRTRTLFMLQSLWLAALIPAMSIGVHQRAIMGAGVAHVVVIVAVVAPAYLLVVTRVTGIPLRDVFAALLPPLAVSGGVAAAAWLASSLAGWPLLQVIAGGAAGGVLYLATAGPSLASVVLNRQVSWRLVWGAISG